MLEIFNSIASIEHLISLFGIFAISIIIANYNSKRFDFYFEYMKDGINSETKLWLERDRFPIIKDSGSDLNILSKIYMFVKNIIYKRKNLSFASLLLKYTLAACVIINIYISSQFNFAHFPFLGSLTHSSNAMTTLNSTLAAVLIVYALPFPSAAGKILRNCMAVGLPVSIYALGGDWAAIVVGFVNAFSLLFLFQGRSVFRTFFVACIVFCAVEWFLDASGNRRNAEVLGLISVAGYASGELSSQLKKMFGNQLAMAASLLSISVITAFAVLRVGVDASNPLVSYLFIALIAIPPLSSLVSITSFFMVRRFLPSRSAFDGRHILILAGTGLLFAWIFTRTTHYLLAGLVALGGQFDLAQIIGIDYATSAIELRFVYSLFVIALLPIFVAVLLGFYQAISANMAWTVPLKTQPSQEPFIGDLLHDSRLLASTDTLVVVILLGLSALSLFALNFLVEELGFHLFRAWIK